MAAKRNFLIKLMAYLDTEVTNNPKDVVINTTEQIDDVLGEEQTYRIDNIPASTTDLAIEMGFNPAKVLFIKNMSTLLVSIKLNSNLSTAISIGPGKVFYLESVNTTGTGLITSLFVTNSNPASAVKLKIFASN